LETLRVVLTKPKDAAESTSLVEDSTATELVLADGRSLDISGLDEEKLRRLQWEQERQFARRILDADKGSRQRVEATCQAYDTVTAIVDAAEGILDETLVMGMDPRYEQIVLHVLRQQGVQGRRPSFFEIGYGAGSLLKRLSDAGYQVAGIEVSASLYQRARSLMEPRQADRLMLGDFLGHQFDGSEDRFSLVYWNDVFEHIPPDEIGDYLDKIHDLLLPGGSLVTITPNWHARPADITAMMYPPRTEAAGLHLKEYSLREVTRLLRKHGFTRVATPLFFTHSRTFMCGGGLAGLKRLFEPALEWLPFRLAEILCRGFCLSCTVATKDR
jgi:SAM-dependent methyltransferase